ncbi:MAG: transcriptional repressor [Candidatus Krumholzibacteriota bacterium]|nr:transcriptional repressor [Candidatus Krumholzibacteriota bacterium]
MKADVFQKLKKQKITLTPQRMAIIEYLIQNYSHPTADDIFMHIRKKYTTISRATVYSTLKLLLDLGEIQELSIRKRGEVCFDTSREPHHHFLCRQCGKIIDIELPYPHKCQIVQAGENQRCQVEEMQAYLYGVCSECDAGAVAEPVPGETQAGSRPG